MDAVVNKRILVLGHSHLGALVRAYAFYHNDQNARRPFDVEFLPLLDDFYQPNVGYEFDDFRLLGWLGRYLGSKKDRREGERVRRLNPSIKRQFGRIVRRQKPDLIVSCAMGNEHNALAMINHPQRFDFYLPSRPDLPTDETADILPVGLVADLIHARLARKLPLYLDMMSDRAGVKIHVPPPPPIRDGAHVQANPGKFAERIEKFGVSPPFFRLKMWTLTCELQEKLCQERGIIFHQLPEIVFDPDGFRAQRFWGRDATHGNAHYGRALLDSIVATSLPRG